MKTQSTALTTLAAALTLTAVGFVPTGTPLADVNVSGLACQAPTLADAEGLRWHEHYIMNPGGDQARWVVCPLPFETLFYPETFGIWVSGVKTPGVTAFPACAFNAVSLYNEDIPGFVDRPGARRKAIAGMQEIPFNTQNWAFQFLTTRGTFRPRWAIPLRTRPSA
jgi:hypothetical protein